MKTSKQLRQQADELNAVIHRRNLYVCHPSGGNRRVIDARVKDGGVVVRDLYTEVDIPINSETKMADGYGDEVLL